MYVCPLCNQMEQSNYECRKCQFILEDRGRLTDYFGDYSPYLDIEGLKMVDGFPNDQKNHECPHVFYCPNCRKQTIYLINEIEF